jgi:hypothetical protein
MEYLVAQFVAFYDILSLHFVTFYPFWIEIILAQFKLGLCLNHIGSCMSLSPTI